MATFFTSDHHFGHANIISYCDRPFDSVEEMDRVLIERWNEVVTDENIVYHLSDFTLSDRKVFRSYLSQLNGAIRILSNPWHHDRRWLPKRLGLYPGWNSASGIPIFLLPPLHVLEILELGHDGYPLAISLCHYPLSQWDRKHYGAWHLHGHCHGTYQAEGKILDVGVDNCNFYPIGLERIAILMEGPKCLPM